MRLMPLTRICLKARTLLPVTVLLVSHCTTTQPEAELSRARSVNAKTILPPVIRTDESLVPAELEFPKAMVSTAYVVRKVAEMRVGPGTQFKLKDSLISLGDRVVALERSGPWQKVVLPEKSEAGWVHRATLGRIELNTKPLIIKSELLPRVFATRKLSRIFPYQAEGRAEIRADIPKGESFVVVRYGSDRVLVYLSATDSVVWLDGGIVQ